MNKVTGENTGRLPKPRSGWFAECTCGVLGSSCIRGDGHEQISANKCKYQ